MFAPASEKATDGHRARTAGGLGREVGRMNQENCETGLDQISTPLEVLVVDDEPAVRYGLSKWLSQRQFSVRTAADLQSALNAVLQSPPDVILLDIRLSTEDGLQLVPLLARIGLDIPCVALTAHAGPHEGFKAHELGIVELLEKPSSPDEIAATLRKAARLDRSRSSALQPILPPGSKASLLTLELQKLVEEQFSTKTLSLSSLARLMGVSPGHLSKVFRQHKGLSVMASVHQRRVALAADLLQTTTQSIKVIADACGYHGASELDRHFARRYGVSPIQFRIARNFKCGSITKSASKP
jgi:YesN/AraC family two-component response regulator